FLGNEFTECDLLAASPADKSRPIGITGVPPDQIDSAKAVPACQAALAIHPSDARVMFQLARALERSGSIVLQKEAARLYKLAAHQSYAVAQNNLGTLYARGRGGLVQDEREAVRLYKLAADQGNAVAQNNLGWFYENGKGGLAQDEREAARLYK